MHVLGFAGSLRRESLNRKLLAAYVAAAPDGVTVAAHDLAGLPLYDGDVEAEGPPPAVTELQAAVRAADALLIVTPEYNASMPAVTKNAVDWLSRPPKGSALAGKPVAIGGASPGAFGTIRSQTHLRQVLGFCQAQAMLTPDVVFMKAGARFDEHGALADPADVERLRAQLEALAAWTVRLGASPSAISGSTRT